MAPMAVILNTSGNAVVYHVKLFSSSNGYFSLGRKVPLAYLRLIHVFDIVDHYSYIVVIPVSE